MSNKVEQGQDARDIFETAYPALYAAETPVNGGFVRMATVAASLAHAYHGLFQKRVMDIGCGYGTTAMAMANFSPREIVAVDRSKGMMELLQQVLFSDDNIGYWLGERQADKILGKFFAPTLRHLKWMRQAFQTGTFRRQGGILRRLLRDGLYLEQGEAGEVDVILGNNYLHWPVQERRETIADEEAIEEDEILRRACRDALLPLRSVLAPTGLVIMVEPEDFVTFDDDPVRERDIEKNAFVAHPVFIKFHEAFNRILKEECGIEREVPQRVHLFKTSQLPSLMKAGGFDLKRIDYVESVSPSNPVDECLVALPMLLGEIDLPFQVKLDMGKRVERALMETLTEEETQLPIREQISYLILKPI